MTRRSRFTDDMSTLDAKFAAQRLAFGPLIFQAARVLRDSGALDYLNRNARDGATPEQVAEAELGLSVYAARVLLEAGYAAGMLRYEEGRYYLTKVGYLVLRDPMTRVNFDFVQDVCYRGAHRFDEAIREGRPAGLREFGDWNTVYEGLSQLPEDVRRSWFAFDHFYSDTAFSEALPLVFARKPKTLLDIGGNTGKWALRCCEHDPDVKVTIVDHPGQLAQARANAAQRGFAERIDGVAVDLLDHSQELPAGHDAIWMSQFLDCFGEQEIVSILRRVARAMSPDSRAFILEPCWDNQRYEASRFSIIGTSLYFTCIANGNSKMFHSERLLACVAEAGLVLDDKHEELGISHTLFVCKRA